MVDGIMILYAYLKLKIEIINSISNTCNTSILNKGNMLMIIKKILAIYFVILKKGTFLYPYFFIKIFKNIIDNIGKR